MKVSKGVMIGVAGLTLGLGATIVFLGTYGSRRPSKSSYPKLDPPNPRVTAYFSPSYRVARDRFLEAANNAGAAIESFEHPHAGPDGESLFTDVALIGPTGASNILVMGSGTHGVEGFAGSGIQTGLVREGIASRLPPGVSLVFIHAINPYGFAHLRRFNEDNVDLNRNFRDQSTAPKTNHGYEELADILAPRTLSFWSEVVTWSRILWLYATDKRELQEAITGGQYSHPEGLFYGGTFDTWSNKTLHSIIDRYLSRADRVVLVDFHTGLGPFGYGEIILNVRKNDKAPVERAVAIWGPDRVRSTDTGESVSVHLDASVKVAFAKALGGKVTAVSLEFGTEPGTEVVKALRAENWLHHHGGVDHPEAKEIKNRLLRAFYPDSDEWKTAVWNQGKGVVDQALIWINT